MQFYLIASHIDNIRNNSLPKDDPNYWITTETIRLATSIKKKENTSASVILDMGNQKILKDRFGKRNFKEWQDYFLTHYQNQIDGWLKTQLDK